MYVESFISTVHISFGSYLRGERADLYWDTFCVHVCMICIKDLVYFPSAPEANKHFSRDTVLDQQTN